MPSPLLSDSRRLAGHGGRLPVLLPCLHALCTEHRAHEFPPASVPFTRLEVGGQVGGTPAELTYFQGDELVAAVLMSDRVPGEDLPAGLPPHVVVLDADLFGVDGRLVARSRAVNLEQVHAGLRELRRVRGSVSVSQLAGHRRYQETLRAAFTQTYARYPLTRPTAFYLCGPCDQEREEMFGFAVASHAPVTTAASPAPQELPRSLPVAPSAELDLEGQSRVTGLALVRPLDAQLLAYARQFAREIALFLEEPGPLRGEQVEQTCFVSLRCRCGRAFCGVWSADEVFWPDVLPGRLRFDASAALPAFGTLPPRRTWVNVCPSCAQVTPLPARPALLGGKLLRIILGFTRRPV